MSCLVIKNDGIGDLVLSSGVLSWLSEQFDGELDLVTCETNREVAEMIPGIRLIYYVSRDNLRFPQNGVNKPSIGEEDKVVLLKIALQKYDVAICLRRFIRQSSLIIMNCVSAKEKYCCWQIPTNASWSEAENFSKGWNHHWGNKWILSELEYFWDFCSKFTNNPIHALPKLRFDSQTDHARDKGKIVAIGISGGTVKPAASWANFSKLLSDQGFVVHLLGGDQQQIFANFISQLVPSVINQVGKLTIYETLQYLNGFYYYVGNDTGLSHLASLVVPKVLVVLGGGTFPRFFPWPERSGQHVIFHGLDCYDCDWQCKYPSHYCLELVSPKTVLEYFLKIVNGEKIPRMINIGNPHTKYQLLWRRCQGEQEKINFNNLKNQ